MKRTTTHFGIPLFYAGFGVSDSLVILREETKSSAQEIQDSFFLSNLSELSPQVTPLKLHLPKERRAYVCGYDLGQPRP